MAHDIIYREFQPYKALTPYIDAFWTVTGANLIAEYAKLLPDGCIDIILNIGPAYTTEQDTVRLNTGVAYLVGTMTRYKEMHRPPGTMLLGIRFKPGGFSCFYPSSILKDTANCTIEFDPALFPVIQPGTRDLTAVLNRFFLERFTPPPQPLLSLLEDIYHRATVNTLAKKHFMTHRQLERLFRLHLDISPKEFIDFTRYQRAMDHIKRQRSGQTLLDIALDCGYYDHAHMTKEIKKLSGASPSRQ